MVAGSVDIELGVVVNLVHPHETLHHRVLNQPRTFDFSDISPVYDDCYIHFTAGESVVIDATSVFDSGEEQTVETVPAGSPIFVYTNADPDSVVIRPISGGVPVLGAIASESVEWDGTPYSVTPSNTGGNRGLSYSYTANPAYPGLTFSTTSGSVSFTPNSAAVVNITITATNDDGTDSVSFTLTIADTTPPVATFRQ